MDAVTSALQQIGVEKPSWKTVLAAVSQETTIPPESLWETWSELENWLSWSKPLHMTTRWIGQPGWEVGAQFEQVLNLGFPLGKLTSAETVGAVVPGQRVVWWKQENGVKSCHIWEFEPLDDHRTRITNVEVFDGMVMGLVKPFVARKWQQLFEQAVAGLIQRTQMNSVTDPSSTS
jgi:hypothetical protein